MQNVADVGFGASDFFRHPVGTKCYWDYTKSCKNVQCCGMVTRCTLTIKGTPTADIEVESLDKRRIDAPAPYRQALLERQLDVHFVSPVPVGAGLVPARLRATTRVAPTLRLVVYL